MGKWKRDSRGFTLIASLLLLALLSAVAVGLMYTVTGSGRVGGNDLESNMAYYGAESGMEKLTSDLLNLYQQELSPSAADLSNLAKTSPPSSAQIPGMTYLEGVTWTNVDAKGNPVTSTSVISSGAYAGLTAEIIPITLNVTATRPSGASVNMTRGVEIALIPVFQFGVFCNGDCSYFAGPQFGFKGRVHANGNLFLAADSGPLILDAKVTAVNQIIRTVLANGFSNGSNYQGSVFVPTQSGGCDSYVVPSGTQGPNCADFGPDNANNTDDSSWDNGVPPAGTANGTFASNVASFNGMVANGAVGGVKPLQLPFVQGATGGTDDQQIQIIRKPATTAELPSSPLGSSREYNRANIRILLGDTQAELHPDGSAFDADDIDLTGGCTPSVFAVTGAPGGTTGTAWADSTVDAKWVKPFGGLAGDPCSGAGAEKTNNHIWPLYSGWLRVEYKPAGTTTFKGVTAEWLQLGWARANVPPATALTGNSVNPQAILLLQELADRNADGALNATDNPQSISGNNSWYPINFFDAREGFTRDPSPSPLGGTQCYANGVMNAVELDVGNLQQWLLGKTGASGTLVDPSTENGYLVYFSDRRGQEPDPNATPVANVTTGKSGLEDVINTSNGNGTPDGKLEPVAAGYNNNNGFSPEDVDENGKLDNWGANNLTNGFGIAPTLNPYVAIDCLNTGRQNKVTGARHVLRLVDGALGNLPLPGFTVASENPVYVLGDYNSVAGDSAWNNPPTDSTKPQHAAAAIIADAITLLSNPAPSITKPGWSDLIDMENTNTRTNRNAQTTYYRMAIAGGKNMDFPQPNGTGNDFGTDGGIHNFLRYIEDWSNTSLFYRGSLISLYYSEYATGTFKCCNLVYSPPTRQYYFDDDFLTPADLPPGTPMLQDVDTLSYWQNFTPCTTQGTGGACSN